MHLWRLWIALGLFAASAASAAVVYKWTDAGGVVHFSDQAVPGAEKIVTASGTNNGIGGQGTSTNPTPNAAAGKPAGSLKIIELAIDSPSKEQVFFGDDAVPVHLHLVPALQENQTVAWQLNGQQLDDQAGALSFTLQPMPRGSYTITAVVMDSASGESQSAEGITFYVRQPSELAPQHKKS
jgi:Domain of unknown function (DUF4124)